MKHIGLILAIAVILIANGVAFVGVIANRLSAPFEVIELTERELPLQNADQENTGVDLRLEFARPSGPADGVSLDCAKLAAVGFDFGIPTGTPARDISLLPRAAYVALEYEGEAWKRWLEQARQRVEFEKKQEASAQQRPSARSSAGEPEFESHLVPVDASLSFAELRGRYPDQNRHLIVRAVLYARLSDVKDPKSGAIQSLECSGYVSQILPSYIHVPLPHAKLLSPLKPQTGGAPRYSVTLHYGSRLEPWVAAVRIH